MPIRDKYNTRAMALYKEKVRLFPYCILPRLTPFCSAPGAVRRQVVDAAGGRLDVLLLVLVGIAQPRVGAPPRLAAVVFLVVTRQQPGRLVALVRLQRRRQQRRQRRQLGRLARVRLSLGRPQDEQQQLARRQRLRAVVALDHAVHAAAAAAAGRV